MDRQGDGGVSGEAVVKGPKDPTEMRELITVACGGITLRGTYHRSQDGWSDSQRPREQRIGILFLNPGYLPRAAAGDAAVYWADSFAECGYPSYRFDLPGHGDSGGDIPIEMFDWVDLVNAGHYAPFVSSIVKDLTERFDLSGVVLVGHCGGSVSAIYASGASKEVKGLVVMDPYFFLPREGTNIRKELRSWVRRNWLAGHISNIYHRLRRFSLLLRGEKRLPGNANLPLIRCWNQLVSAGLPILVLLAPKPRPAVAEFDYLSHLLSSAPRKHRIVVEKIEGTNHSFAKGPGKDAVRKLTGQWLSTSFPLTRCEDGETSDPLESMIDSALVRL
jgi:pimeloyl-ACP methyl ester carboxylesterase